VSHPKVIFGLGLIDRTQQFIAKFAEAFAVWVAQHAQK
jgi:hypothetical protein